MIIPAFDFMDNKVLRLYQGNYSKKKYYNINIYKSLHDYRKKNVKFVHLVDLDGAKNNKNRQLEFFKEIISHKIIDVQVGGGIRTEEDINSLLTLGVKRVVIGSAVIKNKKQIKYWLKNYGSDAIVLALDIQINKDNKKEISINGWQKKTSIFLEDIMEYFLETNLKYVLCTDISKDGTLLGPNIILYQEIVKKFKNICFQASGGISNLQDITNLKKTGVKNIIIGRSLLEKKFTIEEAMKCWQEE